MSTPAASPADRAEGDELTRLASADNFRDVVGPGYLTSDGVPLRAGVFYRSNELQLTHEDAGTIEALGVTAIFDLRDLHEVEAHPDLPVPGATWTHLEVKGIPPGAGAEIADADAATEVMLAIYRRFVDDADARTSFGTLLRQLATSSTPQLFHCTAGKDRTGWTAALLLHVAGVARDVVEADYLLTNTVASGMRTTYLALVAEHLGTDRVPTFERIMMADLDYLHAAFAQADASYGSLEAYLREGLGLTDDDLAALRARLTP